MHTMGIVVSSTLSSLEATSLLLFYAVKVFHEDMTCDKFGSNLKCVARDVTFFQLYFLQESLWF